MPTAQDLMGASIPYPAAAILGNNPQLLVAAGTTQPTAAVIASHLVEMTATGSDGITFPTNFKVGTPAYIYNSSGSNGTIYVPSGHTLNNSLNGTLVLASHKAAILIQYKYKFWSSNLTA